MTNHRFSDKFIINLLFEYFRMKDKIEKESSIDLAVEFIHVNKLVQMLFPCSKCEGIGEVEPYTDCVDCEGIGVNLHNISDFVFKYLDNVKHTTVTKDGVVFMSESEIRNEYNKK